MYSYLKDVAAFMFNAIHFMEAALESTRPRDEAGYNREPYTTYLNSTNIMAAAIKATIEELKEHAKLQINNVSQRNLGRCYNEYTWSVKSSYDLHEDFIKALRECHLIDDGQQFSIGEQHKAEDGLFERIITVTVDSSD